MKNVLVVGGVASGKTQWFSNEIQRNTVMDYFYGSTYAVRIPMTLIKYGYTNLLSLPEQFYIETIRQNKGIDTEVFPRQEMDDFARRLYDTYSGDIVAKIVLRLLNPKRSALVDNVGRVANVKTFKKKGFYVIGLDCDFETRVQRAFQRKKDIDPADIEQIRKQIKDTDEFLEADQTLELADIIYTTFGVGTDDSPDSKQIIEDALRRIRA